MAVLPNHRNHGGGSLSELVLILLYFRNVPIEANHYYPWGGLMAVSTGGDAQRYKFSGKELIRDHGIDWYDHGSDVAHDGPAVREETWSNTIYVLC